MVVVLAPVLVLVALGRLDRRLFTALWIVPLAFIAANASPVQLLWQLFPGHGGGRRWPLPRGTPTSRRR